MGRRRLEQRVSDVPWPAGLAARMMAASAGPEDRRQSDAPPRGALPLPGDGSRSRSLPPPEERSQRERKLTDVIVERRSGGLRPGPLSDIDLSTLLTAAAAPVPNTLMPTPRLAPVVCPLVFDVQGTPAAAYRYVPARHALWPIRAIERDAACDALLLQHEHGSGAAILFFAVPMAEWLRRHGDRGYRGAALQVGYITDRVYLAAESLRLTYTASGGFALARVDEVLGLDGYRHTTMFCFVVGARRAEGTAA